MESAGKRILMLLENNPMPNDTRVRREAESLTEAGYRVAVISPARKGQPWNEVIDGVEIYRYPQPANTSGTIGYMWEYAYSLVSTFVLSLYVFATKGFDVLHAHNPPDTFVLIAAFYKLFGKRFIFDHHDLSPEMYNALFNGRGKQSIYKTLLFFEKLTFRLADHVISTNNSYKEIAATRGGVQPSQITVVRNGPQFESRVTVPPDQELRQKAKYIIGYVGVMGFQDGVDYLIRALAHLVNDLGQNNFYCVIIGRGDAVESLKTLTHELGLDPYVWFTGFIPTADMIRYLSTTDICVDPDPSNPFNDRSSMIKMTEYMSYGKPIVAFDLPEHRVTAQDAALYAKPNDELDFARKIAELMDSEEKRQRMGEIGLERLEKELSWKFQERKLLSAYSTLFYGAAYDHQPQT